MLIKVIPDATKCQHKLRVNYRGPYKILQNYENNLLVVPWWDSYRNKLLPGFKYEGKNAIPKSDLILDQKDRCKPTSRCS